MNGKINSVTLTLIIMLVSVFTLVQITGCNSESNAEQGAETAKEEQVTEKQKVENPFAQANEQNPFEQKKDPNAANEAPAGPTTSMKFEKMEHDFGKIKDGDKVSHTFKFTNTGKEPLIITNAKGSCGCTVPKWPKEPLAPGETGEMLVSFDSKGKPGNQSKTVTVTANTEPAITRLTIRAEVEKNEAAAEATN